jgi:hypothetical protein
LQRVGEGKALEVDESAEDTKTLLYIPMVTHVRFSDLQSVANT